MLKYELIIDNILAEKELSYAQAAALTKVPKSTLYKICTGAIDPRFSTLIKISNGLNVPLEELYKKKL